MSTITRPDTTSAELLAVLESSRLLTLTGPPGADKSRLAAELAAGTTGSTATPVKRIDLAGATELGLLEQLGDQPRLVVLDNCEQAAADVAILVESLLSARPSLRILATSQERLGITGEVVRRVGSTPLGTDGHPDTAGSRDSGRHPTAEEAMAASEALLSEPERLLLGRLSVFAGGFSLDAARHVCAGGPIEADQVLHLLGRLVDTSMVEVHTSAGGRSRYRLAPVAHAHAEARLAQAGEEEQLRADHAAWYATVLESVPRVGLDRARHVAWVARLEADHDNLRAAVDWAVDRRQAALAVRLARGQLVFWRLTGAYREAAASLKLALSVAHQAPAPLRASAHCDAGLVAAMLGEQAAAGKHLEKSLALFDGSDPTGAACARNVLALISVFTDEPDVAMRRLEENLERARGAGNDVSLSEALATLGAARMLQGEAGQAAGAFGETTEAARRAGDEALLAHGLVGTGWAALARAEFDEAATSLEEGLALARELGERYREAVALGWLGELARLRGDARLARKRLKECRRLATSMATPYPLARSLVGLARLALDVGDARRAERLLDKAVAVATRAGLNQLVAVALEALAEAALVQGQPLATARFEKAMAVARRGGDKATTARCLWGLASAARAAGKLERAWPLHHQALRMRHEIGDSAGAVDSLEALAGIAISHAGPLVPARLFGAAEALRATLGYPRPPLAQEPYEADVAALHSTVGQDDLVTAWAQGTAMTLPEAVSYASRGRGRQRQPRSGLEGLTETEHQVAALVAEGLHNPAIAEQMLMSRETVKTHVSRIFVKLGVSSRRQLGELVQNTSK